MPRENDKCYLCLHAATDWSPPLPAAPRLADPASDLVTLSPIHVHPEPPAGLDGSSLNKVSFRMFHLHSADRSPPCSLFKLILPLFRPADRSAHYGYDRLTHSTRLIHAFPRCWPTSSTVARSTAQWLWHRVHCLEARKRTDRRSSVFLAKLNYSGDEGAKYSKKGVCTCGFHVFSCVVFVHSLTPHTECVSWSTCRPRSRCLPCLFFRIGRRQAIGETGDPASRRKATELWQP